MLLIILGLTGLLLVGFVATIARARHIEAVDDTPVGVGTYSIASLPDFRYRQRRFFQDGRYWR